MTNTTTDQKDPEHNEPDLKPPKTNKKPTGSRTFSTVIIVLLVLVVLALGAYLIKKNFDQKTENQSNETNETKELKSENEGTTSVKKLIETLLYPESKIIDQKQEMDGVYVAEVNLSSADTIDKIKDYYLSLIEKNDWNVTEQGSDPNFENYFITFTDKIFSDSLDITKYDNDDFVTIRHRLNGEDLISDGLYIPTSSNSATLNTINSPSASSTVSASLNDYVISDSDKREISKSELTSFTPWQLKVARNEIYARHGRLFVHEDLKCYFKSKNWYFENTNFNTSLLSSIESKNIDIIQNYEKETNSPLANYDSGCNSNN